MNFNKSRFAQTGMYLVTLLILATNGCTITRVPEPKKIGELHEGGRIAYLLQSGDPGFDKKVQHGLIVTETEISLSSKWGCAGTDIPGTKTALGTGNQNTQLIMAACPDSGIAARICGDLVLNGFSDWYLPSKDELELIFQNGVGAFVSVHYWSSSQFTPNEAWHRWFFTGEPVSTGAKVGTAYVRAVRSF
jgi:hypothetical protein